jgi:hypothetical protein
VDGAPQAKVRKSNLQCLLREGRGVRVELEAGQARADGSQSPAGLGSYPSLAHTTGSLHEECATARSGVEHPRGSPINPLLCRQIEKPHG